MLDPPPSPSFASNSALVFAALGAGCGAMVNNTVSLRIKTTGFIGCKNILPHGCSVSFHPIITHDARDVTAKLTSASGILHWCYRKRRTEIRDNRTALLLTKYHRTEGMQDTGKVLQARNRK